VPTGRLVVLGEPGSGKTVLVLRLVLDLLERRRSGEPVPVLVSAASWDPAVSGLYGWLAGQLALSYPSLAGTAEPGSVSRRFRALIDSGLIVPVLDGLDEIRPGPGRPGGTAPRGCAAPRRCAHGAGSW
jgi:predicted NACHT family NTPase